MPKVTFKPRVMPRLSGPKRASQAPRYQPQKGGWAGSQEGFGARTFLYMLVTNGASNLYTRPLMRKVSSRDVSDHKAQTIQRTAQSW